MKISFSYIVILCDRCIAEALAPAYPTFRLEPLRRCGLLMATTNPSTRGGSPSTGDCRATPATPLQSICSRGEPRRRRQLPSASGRARPCVTLRWPTSWRVWPSLPPRDQRPRPVHLWSRLATALHSPLQRHASSSAKALLSTVST